MSSTVYEFIDMDDQVLHQQAMSRTRAVQFAEKLIEDGESDVVVIGGADMAVVHTDGTVTICCPGCYRRNTERVELSDCDDPDCIEESAEAWEAM